ncbi:MAG TPA: class I SAM-dependent methyltransferase [Candidatus Bathyarchaeia archaeon]|nr:class I SAM-dependent methyltransferase [Candidatus Bathyarchaeia archaeon]
MDQELSRLLDEISEFGRRHDSSTTVHSEQMLNITPDTGLFLSILIQALRVKSVLEIGTSDGYSTIWIADALRSTGGRVTTVEFSKKKVEMARKNFEKVEKLSEHISLHEIDIRAFLKDRDDESFDLIFLDADRPQYASYWIDVCRVLRTGSLLIVDNALSPHPEELAEFFKLIQSSGTFLSQTLNIGKGEMIALKLSTPRN